MELSIRHESGNRRIRSTERKSEIKSYIHIKRRRGHKCRCTKKFQSLPTNKAPGKSTLIVELIGNFEDVCFLQPRSVILSRNELHSRDAVFDF